jgi:hypothetical protein
MDSCGFKVTYGGGEKSCDCVQLVLCSFHYSNKKYDTGGSISDHLCTFLIKDENGQYKNIVRKFKDIPFHKD